MSYTTSKLEWLSFLLKDIHISIPFAIPLHCDNRAAIHIAENPVFHEQTKHLNIDCHCTWDKLLEGFLHPTHVGSKNQLADIMTKPLCKAQHHYLASRLGLMDSPIIPL